MKTLEPVYIGALKSRRPREDIQGPNRPLVPSQEGLQHLLTPNHPQGVPGPETPCTSHSECYLVASLV